MKILTWNCNGAFRKKIELIKSLDADIYIIQECENLDKAKGAYENWLPYFIWKGFNQNKGIGVFSKLHIKELSWDDENLELFLPLLIDNYVQFIAVWAKHANSPTFQYIGQLWKYLQLHHQKISEKPTILCGDFNSNSRWDVWDRWWNHSDVVGQLDSMDIKSLYHQITEEEQGKESQSTFYMHRNPLKPYHIDFLFAHNSLFQKKKSKVDVFCKEKWLSYSDHIPILFTLEK